VDGHAMVVQIFSLLLESMTTMINAPASFKYAYLVADAAHHTTVDLIDSHFDGFD